MQNPMTPTLPVQSSLAASQLRVASTSSKLWPRPARTAWITEITQSALLRLWKRSGATAR